jgi:hypothetical protein
MPVAALASSPALGLSVLEPCFSPVERIYKSSGFSTLDTPQFSACSFVRFVVSIVTSTDLVSAKSSALSLHFSTALVVYEIVFIVRLHRCRIAILAADIADFPVGVTTGI